MNERDFGQPYILNISKKKKQKTTAEVKFFQHFKQKPPEKNENKKQFYVL